MKEQTKQEIREKIFNQPSYWIESIELLIYDAIVQYRDDTLLSSNEIAKYLEIDKNMIEKILDEKEFDLLFKDVIKIAHKLNKKPILQSLKKSMNIAMPNYFTKFITTKDIEVSGDSDTFNRILKIFTISLEQIEREYIESYSIPYYVLEQIINAQIFFSSNNRFYKCESNSSGIYDVKSRFFKFKNISVYENIAPKTDIIENDKSKEKPKGNEFIKRVDFSYNDKENFEHILLLHGLHIATIKRLTEEGEDSYELSFEIVKSIIQKLNSYRMFYDEFYKIDNMSRAKYHLEDGAIELKNIMIYKINQDDKNEKK